MAETITVRCAKSKAEAHRMVDRMYQEHRYFKLEAKQVAGTRTLSQNAALHLFCGWLAQDLTDAGLDMRKTLKPDVEIPWTTDSVKEYMWRPIQKALTQKHSTTEITTVEPTVIHQTLARYLADNHGVVCPAWPTREREAA